MKLTRPHILFAIMCAVWGATWIPLKMGLAVVPPSLFAGTRFVPAGLLLLGILAARGESLRVARRDWGRLAAVTMLMMVATYGLLYWGASFVSSGLAAVLDLAFMPVALLAMSAAFGEERLTRPRAIGVAVGVVGLLILFGPKAWAERAGGTAQIAGAAAIIVSVLTYCLGSVLARPLLRRYPPVLISGLSTLAGGIVLLVGALLFERNIAVALAGHWGTAVWAGWVFLVLFGSLGAATIFLQLLHEWGAARASSYAFISPIIAVALGMAVFGEAVTAVDVAGMTTMLVGAWLTLRAEG